MNRVCKAPELSDQDQEMLGPSTLPGRIVANLMMGAKLGLHIPAANNQRPQFATRYCHCRGLPSGWRV